MGEKRIRKRSSQTKRYLTPRFCDLFSFSSLLLFSTTIVSISMIVHFDFMSFLISIRTLLLCTIRFVPYFTVVYPSLVCPSIWCNTTIRPWIQATFMDETERRIHERRSDHYWCYGDRCKSKTIAATPTSITSFGWIVSTQSNAI